MGKSSTNLHRRAITPGERIKKLKMFYIGMKIKWYESVNGVMQLFLGEVVSLQGGVTVETIVGGKKIRKTFLNLNNIDAA